MKTRYLWAHVCIVSLGVPLADAQAPLGTVFTYQGQLKLAGAPLNAPADFQFWLWDADVGGNLVAPPLLVDNWPVASGLFTVRLDFGPNAFYGDARWLEIWVRSPAGSGGDYTVLAPRQELTATPNAQFAQYAQSAQYAQYAGSVTGGITGSGTTDYMAKFTGAGTVGNSAIFESGGSVGVGTTSPLARLHVQSDDTWPALALHYVGNPPASYSILSDWMNQLAINKTYPGYVLIDIDPLPTAGNAGSVRFFRSTNTTGGKTVEFHRGLGALEIDSQIGVNGGTTFFNRYGGNVGIGTTTPGFPLTFANTLGDKLSLFGQSGNHYGFGIQAALLQIHGEASASDIAFGHGRSASFTEVMRIKGTGNVGIGTTAPAAPLHVASGGSSTNGVIHGESTLAYSDRPAVMGDHSVTDYYGIGVKGVGGYKGVLGSVSPTGSATYYGVHGSVSGGSGTNCGVYGYASGGSTNYGVYGYAGGGATNYAGYFSGDVKTTGDVYMGASEGTSSIYFFEDGSASGESIYWYDPYDTFIISDHLSIDGDLWVMSGGIVLQSASELPANIETASDLRFYKDRDNDEANAWFQFFTNGFPGAGIEQMRINDGDEADILGDGTFISNGIDYAEAFKVLEADLEPGDVVSAAIGQWEYCRRTGEGYDPHLIGVVSAQPGFLCGMSFNAEEAADPALAASRDQARAAGDAETEKQLTMQLVELVQQQYRPIALAGRVPVKVDAAYGPINAGDRLTSSATAGYAMVQTRPGTSLGIALEDWSAGRGRIMVLVQPGWSGVSDGWASSDAQPGAPAEPANPDVVQGFAEITASLHERIQQQDAEIEALRAALDVLRAEKDTQLAAQQRQIAALADQLDRTESSLEARLAALEHAWTAAMQREDEP